MWEYWWILLLYDKKDLMLGSKKMAQVSDNELSDQDNYEAD